MGNFFNKLWTFFKAPVGVILSTNLFWHIVILALGIPFNSIVSGAILILDILIAIILRNQIIYFFSQFVLPIQNPNDRKAIFARVRNFETGKRGAALFIKNGRVITHKGELEKRNPGVILLDTASALVLRTDTEIRDTVGPGVKFTAKGEYIAGSVDLRIQHQNIGLGDHDKNSPHRAQQTLALTRDGFEISAALGIQFRIKRPAEKLPSESGVLSQYGYDPRAVRNAIMNELVVVNADGKHTRMEWNRLPAHLVVNLWREYVRKFKLDDLLTTNAVSGLQTIEEMINKRVKNPQVVALDDTGLPTGEWLDSREYIHLQARGVEILDVRIHNVYLDSAIENSKIEAWNPEWLKFAEKEATLLKEQEALIETAAREEASKKFALLVSEKFSHKPVALQQTPFKTLQLLLEPLREFIIKESNAKNDLEKELKKLDEILKWLLENNPDADSATRRRA